MTTARQFFIALLALNFALGNCDTTMAQIFNGSPAKSDPPSSPLMHKDADVKQTAWPSIPLPKISMPKISMPDMSMITQPVKSGFSKVTTGTKKAWEGTKEIFTFGKGDSGQAKTATSSQPKQSTWGRMFSTEPEKQDGPQTVGEWMSQPRLDP